MNQADIRSSLPVMGALLFALLLVVQARADTIDVDGQPLPGALREFSDQTGLQLAYVATLAQGKTSPGTQGAPDVDTALAEILDGTELRYLHVNARTVAIGPQRPASGWKRAPEEDGLAGGPLLLAQLQPAEDKDVPDMDEPDEDGEESAPAEEEELLELSAQKVTGSRLLGGDPSAQVFSFTAEEISRRGVSSLEDLFRILPWHFSTVNTQTGMFGSERGDRGDGLFLNGGPDVGIATANLRALGSKNTLVLRDGRRIAGVGGVQQDIVNLLDVPLSSIERVDIQLDGASAIYGADAIGGVVNFITKKDYQGLAASFRQEFGSTGADTRRASINGGYGWRSGNVTATLTQSRTKPIINTELGWTSLDYRPLLGVDFDRREHNNGQPGIVCVLYQDPPPPYPLRDPRIPSCRSPFVPGVPYQRTVFYQLPPDHTGENVQISDFLTTYDSRSIRYDEVPPQNGVDSTRYSLNLDIEQDLTAGLRAYAGVNWIRSDSYQESRRMVFSPFFIPASNAYNPFGAAVSVKYTPSYEFENGLLPQPHDRSEDESRTINLGFYWTLLGKHELNLDMNRTKSWRESGSYTVDPEPYVLEPTSAAFYEALGSPDPARALNVFGNGTVQGSSFDEFLSVTNGPVYGVTETRQYNLSLSGELFGMWGGAASYSVGGERRESIIFYDRSRFSNIRFDDEREPIAGSYASVGVSRPSRQTEAYYAESAFPFFGKENARSGLRSLILTAQARVDVDYASGSFGGREFPRLPGRNYYYDVFDNFAALKYLEGSYFRPDYNPNINRERNSRWSPRIGIHYKPMDTFTFRAAWSRSYTPPYWTQSYSNGEGYETFSFEGLDPYHPAGPHKYEEADNINLFYQPYAENLEPEYSTHWSGSVDWLPDSLPGLRLQLNWSAVIYSNRIRNSISYTYEFPTIMMRDSRIAVRDSEGYLVRVNDRNINIEKRNSEMATAHVEYAFDTRAGRFIPSVGYTRYLADYEQVSADSPRHSELGTQRGQDRYRWQFALNWEWRKFRADLWAYYTPGYLNDRAHRCPLFSFQLPEGSRCEGTGLFTRQNEYLALDVSSLTTIDATLSYSMDNGLRVRVGGRNVLNRSFPLTVNGPNGFIPYDASRWDARGRVLFIDLNWQM